MSRGIVRHGIFVASTNDLIEERNAATTAIVRWNEANWDAGLIFTPLMWEVSAVGDANVERPQDAITNQLLEKASGLIAIFKHRLGSPTDRAPSGTCEEIEEALNRPMFPTSVFFSEENIPQKLLNQAQELSEWRKGLKGLSIGYRNTDDLAGKLMAQLDNWATKLPSSAGSTGLVVETLAAEDYKAWLYASNPEKKPCTLLLYNVELETFRTPESFSPIWNELAREEHVGKVVLLLQSYKLRRLRRYLASWKEPVFINKMSNRFFVAGLSSTRTSKHRVATSTAFCILRDGLDPASGGSFPGARIFSLSEPFSEPSAGSHEPDLVWMYRHTFVTNNEKVLSALLSIWDDGFDSASLVALEDVLSAEATPEPEDMGIDVRKAPSGEEQLSTVRLLREKLFDPNVPSYLMDPNFYILDWNPAFELVFPTDAFYRREHIREFVAQLDNRSDVMKKGARFEKREINLAFDMEPLYFCSPRYRNIQFNKMASRVDDPTSGNTIGWIVALHVNHVEAFDLYEEDLKVVNEGHSLTSVYAQPYDRVLKSFPPYLDLVQRHVSALSSCNDILDCGCGPGALTEQLLLAGQGVTAVDCNDTMLKLAKERFDRMPAQYQKRLSLIKANVETLHRPNVDYDQGKIGIHQGYDGIALLNAFHVLADPDSTLRRIRHELLSEGCTLAMSMPAPDTDLDVLLREIQAHGQAQIQATGERPWSDHDWRVFTQVNRELDEGKVLTRHATDYEQILEGAGFELLDSQRCYCEQGLFVVARAV